MTSRERLFAALCGQSTDHVPVWLLFPYHRLGCYVDVRTLPAYRPVVELAERQAITLNRRIYHNLPLYTPDVTITREDRGNGVIRTTLEGPGNVRLYSEYGPGYKKPLLDRDEDLEAWATLPFLTDPAAIHPLLETHLDAYRTECREFPADIGAMMLALGEPIGPVYGQSNLESYAIWSLTHNDLILSILDRLMQRYRAIYQWCLERRLAEVYFLVGSELASPPLLSKTTFQQWIIPYARELISMVRSAGAFAIQHYHGQILEILDGFVEMNPHALHTIEAPPVGNCTFTQAFDATHDKITLIGNIQYDEFRSRTPGEMRQAVRDVLDECRGRPLILSPSAGPFDADPPPRLIENYLAFMDEAWRYGEWKI